MNFPTRWPSVELIEMAWALVTAATAEGFSNLSADPWGLKFQLPETETMGSDSDVVRYNVDSAWIIRDGVKVFGLAGPLQFDDDEPTP